MRRLACCAVFVSVVAAPGAAAGQDWGLYATGEITVAYDDNIQSAPDDAEAAAAFGTVVADGVIGVTPGLLFTYNAPRTSLSASYARSFFYYVQNPATDSSSDLANLGVSHTLSPVDDIAGVISVQRAPSNLTILGDPADSTTASQRADPLQLLTVSLNQGYQHAFDELWEVAQSLTASTTQPLGEDLTDTGALYTFAATLGPRYRWKAHLFDLESNVQIIDRDVTDETSIIPGVAAGWRWQFAEMWSSELRGGVAVPFDVDGNVRAAPVGSLGAFYQNEAYGVSLLFARNFQSNPALQQVFYSDSASLSGTLPLWRDGGIGVDGSLGAAINRIVDDRQDVDSESAVNVVADVGLSWQPPEVPITTSIRYQHNQQLESTNPEVIPNITRNVVGLSFTYQWPPPDARNLRIYRRRGAPPFRLR